MKRLLIRSWPYLTCFVAGILLFLVGSRLQEEYKGLVINISASFLTIPFLFLIYELVKQSSSRKLNKELFDYAKMQVDREVLSIVMHLIKVVHPYQKQDRSQLGVQAFLNQSEQEINSVFNNETYLGFQVLSRWTVSEGNLTKIIENPFVVQRLEDDQTIAIITLLKSIQRLEDFHRNIAELYEIGESIGAEYITKSGAQIGEHNTTFPDRYLLLRRLEKGKVEVVDFGDFAPYEIQKLLKTCKVNPKYTSILAQAVFGVIEAINGWVDRTDSEFIVDSRMFRIRVPT